MMYCCEELRKHIEDGVIAQNEEDGIWIVADLWEIAEEPVLKGISYCPWCGHLLPKN